MTDVADDVAVMNSDQVRAMARTIAHRHTSRCNGQPHTRGCNGLTDDIAQALISVIDALPPWLVVKRICERLGGS